MELITYQGVGGLNLKRKISRLLQIQNTSGYLIMLGIAKSLKQAVRPGARSNQNAPN